MSDKSKRTPFSPEFKAKVGLEAIRGVKTINEIGQGGGAKIVDRFISEKQGDAVQSQVGNR